jgi:Fic family protein
MATTPSLYHLPHQFEPLLPSAAAAEPLLAKAHTLLTLAHQVTGRADASVMQPLTTLLRGMNSYYTNKIEGQHTLPSQLESALKKQFSTDADISRKQRMAMAHMAAEAWAETTYARADWRALLEPEVVCALHTQLFAPLPEGDRIIRDPDADPDNGKRDYVMQPGQLRTREVRVGQHEAPSAASVPQFMQRFADAYKTTRDGELALVAVAAAHHRLAWIHPFADGNGRVARLHSHLLLQRMGLTNGVWSPMRGLARTQGAYYLHLAQADMPRHGDLDGRGNLSEKRLVEFIDYFLDTCIDQARFMASMLNMQTMRERIRACVAFESARDGSGIRMEAELALYTLFTTGPMERGEFKRITGLAARTAERLLQALEIRGLVRSATPKGKLIFGIPFNALRFYFPNLWPEAEAQVT